MQLSLSKVEPNVQCMYHNLKAAEEETYNKFHFFTRHLISTILGLQATYLTKTMKISQTISFERLIDLMVLSGNELDELQESFANCQQYLKHFPFFNCLEADYVRFFEGIINDDEKKRLMLEHRVIQIDGQNLGCPSNSPFHLVLKLNVWLSPTRFVPEPPCIEESTRLLREFGGRNFIRVEFQDKPQEYLVYRFIKQGFTFAGRYWVYFGQTNGQLEGSLEKSCWFCAYPDRLDNQPDFLRASPYFVFYPDYYQSEEIIELRDLKELKINSCFFRQYCIDWLGDFSHIELVCKISTRQGMCLGKSLPTLSVNDGSVNLVVKPDFEGPLGMYSDGCGEISGDLLLNIQKACNVGPFSALEFRLLGCKGMLQVNPLLRPGTLLLRESQVKFLIHNPTEKENFIEVVNIASASEGYLNEQIIVLLDALGAPSSYFAELLDESLTEYKGILLSNDKIKELLERQKFTFKGGLCLRMLASGVPDSDIVLAQELGGFEDVELSRIQQKFRIKLPLSRFLYGVYDVLNILTKDEVYVSPQDTGGVFVNEVVIAKNPCTHPGNIRKLRVVNPIERFIEVKRITNEEIVMALNQMYSGVIVFPVAYTESAELEDELIMFAPFKNREKHFRPISDQCGGADLDGDIYFVTWDPKIVDSVKIVEPQTIEFSSDELAEAMVVKEQRLECMYGTTEQQMKVIRDHSLYLSEVKWLSERMCNYSLGIIGNALSIAGDIFGYLHPIAAELSRCFNLAVDANKNGWIMTQKTRDTMASFWKIDAESLSIESNIDLVEQLTGVLDQNEPHCFLKPHFFIIKDKGNSSYDIVYHSKSIRGRLFDVIEKIREQEFYSMKSFILNRQQPFLQDKRLYFHGIAEHIKIGDFTPVCSFQSLGIPNKLFEQHYKSINAITRQFMYDISKSHPGRLSMLKEYYFRALFSQFNLMERIVRAIWFYFEVYEANKQKFRAPKSSLNEKERHEIYEDNSIRVDSDYVDVVEEEYIEMEEEAEGNINKSFQLRILENDGLRFMISESRILEMAPVIDSEEVAFNTTEQILENMNAKITVCPNPEGILHVSILNPSEIVFDSRLEPCFALFAKQSKAYNYLPLQFRRDFNRCEQALEQIVKSSTEEEFEAEEEIEEVLNAEKSRQIPANSSTLKEQPNQHLIMNAEIIDSRIIIPKCEFHSGFEEGLWGTPEEREELTLRKNKGLLLSGEQCWHIAGEYLFYAMSTIAGQPVSMTTEWFNMMRIKPKVEFKRTNPIRED